MNRPPHYQYQQQQIFYCTAYEHAFFYDGAQGRCTLAYRLSCSVHIYRQSTEDQYCTIENVTYKSTNEEKMEKRTRLCMCEHAVHGLALRKVDGAIDCIPSQFAISKAGVDAEAFHCRSDMIEGE